MSADRSDPRALRFYRLLWRAYPASFRTRFEASAAEVFEQRYRDVRASRGVAGLVLFWLHTIGNVVGHGTAERLGSLRRGVDGPALWADAVDALRTARRSHRQHIGAILCMALGLSATSSILTLVSSTLLRPLPFPEAERLVRVWTVEENVQLAGRGELSYPDLIDLESSMSSLDRLVVSARSRVMFLGEAGARRVEGEAIGPGYLELLGTEPFLGRSFSDEDYLPSSEPTMLLSFGTWARDYGADPEVIGRTIRTAGGPFTVIGVLPQDFLGTIEADIPDLEFWIPIEHYVTDALRQNRRAEFIWSIGRLAEGATLEQARIEAEVLGRRLVDAGVMDGSSGYWVEPFGENWRADLRWSNYLLLAAAGLLLLVAATNVAGLFVARAMSRQRELAVRAAMGAGRARLIRRTLFETVWITLAGGTLGMVLAPWLLGSFLRLAPEELPGYLTLTPDARSLGLAFAVLAFAALGAGLAPALLSGRVAPAAVLGSGGRSSTQGRSARRTSRWLVVAEVAVTTVLVSSAALLVESYRAMGAVDVGFRLDRVLKLAVFVDGQDVPEDSRLPTFYDELRTALTEVPGVVEIGLASPTVPPGFSGEARARFDGMPEALRENGVLAYTHLVDPGLMPTLDIELIAGRGIERTDDEHSRAVAVISASLAEMMGGADAAVGRMLDLGAGPYEVVGVVEDVLYLGAAIRRPRDIDVYVPLAQDPTRVVSIALVATGDPAELVGPVRARLAELTPRSPLDWVATMPTDLLRGFEGPRFYAVLLMAFAGAALLLTAAGVFAVLAHKVAGERAEMGIRRAFGARRSHLLGAVLRSGLTLCAIGLAVGAVGAFGLSRLLGRSVVGVGALDLGALVVAGLVILATGAAASLVPAMRATRTSPVEAMRDG